MRKLKEILRLKYEAQLSQRQIARSLNLSLGAIFQIPEARRGRRPGLATARRTVR